MAAVAGLTVIKRFDYRGSQEEFSNQYWLSGSVPADSTSWRTLFDALVTAEKTVYPSNVNVVKGYGYATDNPDDNSVWSVDLTISPNTIVPGTLATGAGRSQAPGDSAVWVRWKTSRLNTKGKPIYLRKYYHGAWNAGTGTFDVVMVSQVTALTAFGQKMRDGTFTEGRTIRSQLHPETLLGHGVSQNITTRTLKRRGKRPGS